MNSFSICAEFPFFRKQVLGIGMGQNNDEEKVEDELFQVEGNFYLKDIW